MDDLSPIEDNDEGRVRVHVVKASDYAEDIRQERAHIKKCWRGASVLFSPIFLTIECALFYTTYNKYPGMLPSVQYFCFFITALMVIKEILSLIGVLADLRGPARTAIWIMDACCILFPTVIWILFVPRPGIILLFGFCFVASIFASLVQRHLVVSAVFLCNDEPTANFPWHKYINRHFLKCGLGPF